MPVLVPGRYQEKKTGRKHAVSMPYVRSITACQKSTVSAPKCRNTFFSRPKCKIEKNGHAYDKVRWQEMPSYHTCRHGTGSFTERRYYMKLIGYRRNNFQTQEGNTVTGYNLYLAYPATGDEVEIAYNRYGKPSNIRAVRR